MAAGFIGSGGGCVIVVLVDLLLGCDCSYWFASKKRERRREKERDEV